MKVKKTNNEWKPSENLGLQVGETIEITDPRALILSGMCIAVGEDGEELDSFDLYGVVDKDLVAELKAYKQAKHQEQIKKELEAEEEVLTKALAEAKAHNAKLNEAKDLETMDWTSLKKKAVDAGVFKPDMKKRDVIKALSALID
jgi:L-lactate utilization protein LutC